MYVIQGIIIYAKNRDIVQNHEILNILIDLWNDIAFDREGNMLSVEEAGETVNDIYLVSYDVLKGNRYSMK